MQKYDEEFELIIKEIAQNETVKKMKNYRQHYNTSCYDHCKNVAYISYIMCKKLKLNCTSTARAAMLHDLFLYDWRKKLDGRKGLHAFTHPKTALENSLKIFELSDLEQDIILKHMWPLTIVLPKYPESYIVTLADKISALQECGTYYYERFFSKKSFRMAYLFMLMFIIHI